ncbi:hypothetical protein [Sphaerisporangium perillae]|uniref:hypothetical protein n=1 Tax=Sphaerisporangium perillae TaxID=2935860 RepID=UPI00200F26BE|nr:hypothetical protein [Sphaerisporangium perillae]
MFVRRLAVSIRPARLGVGLAVLALAAAACTAAHGATDPSAAAGTTSATPTAGATVNVATPAPTGTGVRDRSKQAEEFTACMRANGVPGFPGVTISAGGGMQIDLTGEDLDPVSSRFQQAAKTCAHLLPKGSALPEAPVAPALSAPPIHFTCSGPFCPGPPKAPTAPN